MSGKFVWFAAVLAICAAVWFRVSATENLDDLPMERTRLVFVTGGSDDYWQLTAKGAEAAAKEYNADLQVEMLEHDEGVQEQMQILVGLNETTCDGCAISPLDAEGQTRLINRLADKMHVVTFDSDAPLSERHYYVGTSNYRAGQLCFELVSEALPEGGEVVVLLSNLTKNNMEERKSGYVDKNTEDKWKTIEYLTDEGDESKAIENIKQTLEKYPDLDCLVGMNGYHGPILKKVLAELNKTGDVKLVVFDEAEATLAGIEAGEIYATIAQDPYKYGYEAVRMLTSLHNGLSRELPIVGGGQVLVQCEQIRQDELEIFRQRLKQRLAEEMTKAEN